MGAEMSSSEFPDMLEKLAKHGGQPTARVHNIDGSSLAGQAGLGNLDKVKEMLANHPEKIDQQNGGCTALQVASHEGHREVVQFLLDSGANLEVKDNYGATALHSAAIGNRHEIMQLLLSKGADSNSIDNKGSSTLHVAVNKRHQDCIKILLQHGCDVNLQDAQGDTALHDAIERELNQGTINLLINHKDADFTRKNGQGCNALHMAARRGNVVATESILSKCPRLVNAKKNDGFTPLHLAVLNGQKDAASLLLQKGADTDVRNNDQATPLHLAVFEGNASIVELLLDHGAEVGAQDKDGDICLHLALLNKLKAQGEINVFVVDEQSDDVLAFLTNSLWRTICTLLLF